MPDICKAVTSRWAHTKYNLSKETVKYAWYKQDS